MIMRIKSKSAVLSDSPFYGDLAVDAVLTTGLTFAFTAGVSVEDDVATTIAAGTETLTDDATNVVYRQGATMGSAVEDSEPDEVMRLYTVITASGVITSIVDTRGHVS